MKNKLCEVCGEEQEDLGIFVNPIWHCKRCEEGGERNMSLIEKIAKSVADRYKIEFVGSEVIADDDVKLVFKNGPLRSYINISGDVIVGPEYDLRTTIDWQVRGLARAWSCG